jgi:hypothetical protein
VKLEKQLIELEPKDSPQGPLIPSSKEEALKEIKLLERRIGDLTA